LEHARVARDRAYAPYSKFPVGAALLARSGNVYVGCNVENVSYGLSICAERVAVFSAACAGERDIVEIAVVTAAEIPSRPCGACRQVLFEFGKDATVIMGNLKGSVVVRKLRDLFPEPFEMDQ
jgi:cytidine deaminase